MFISKRQRKMAECPDSLVAQRGYDSSGSEDYYTPPQSPEPTPKFPALMTTPTIRELSLLPVADWYLMGLQIGVEESALEEIERNYPRDVRMSKTKMFSQWLRNYLNPNFLVLVQGLVAIGKRNIADSMCSARGVSLEDVLKHSNMTSPSLSKAEPSPIKLPTPPPECVATYAQHLKDRYKRMSVLPDCDWPPSIGRQYSKLAMIEIERDSLPDAETVATMERDYIHGNIDNIVARKTSVEFPEVFVPSSDEEQLKILMDGAPGVGKTTLTRKACVDWANGELLQQYHLVVLVPLRELRYRNSTEIDDLFPADDLEEKVKVLQHIRKSSGEHVLFIFDGYDELSLEERTQQSLFLDIIRGDKLCKSSVLVTSRPYASDNLQCLECINRHIEVLGFTEEQIKECIKKNFSNGDEAAELMQILAVRSDIASLCYFPFNCAIIFSVFKHEHCLPTTVTDLYESFVLSGLKRNTKDPKIARKISSSLKNLPTPLCDQLDSLCKLAYTGLVEDKLVFTYADLEVMLGSDSADVEQSLFGLMTAVRSFSSCSEINFQFVHLTIQEFLAAMWVIRKLSKEDQWKFISENLENKRFRMVLLFVAGLSRLEFPIADTSEMFSGFKFGGKAGKLIEVSYFFFLAQMIFESQNLSLFSFLVNGFTNTISTPPHVFTEYYTITNTKNLNLSFYHLTPFDCFILSHFISWSADHWDALDLNCCGLNAQCFDIMYQVSSQFSEQCRNVSFTMLDISNNDDYISHCLNTKTLIYPSPVWLHHTRKLAIHTCNTQWDCEQQHSSMPLNCGLKSIIHLDIRLKSDTPTGMPTRSTAVIAAFLPCLETLMASYITEVEFDCLMRSLHHNSSMKELDISCNKEGLAALAQMISHNKTLTKLTLTKKTAHSSSVTDAVTVSFSDSSTSTSDPNISLVTMGWVHFFQSLQHNSSLKELDISGNKLDEDELAALAQMISYNKTLTKLTAYSDTGVNVEFHHSSLIVSDNPSVTSMGWVNFFQSLHHNSALKELDISDNILGEEGSEALAQMISHNKTLTKLIADSSGLTDAGLRIPFHDSSISELDISRNITVTSMGWVNFFQSLHHNSSLKELDTSHNKLGEEGSEALAQMISHNKTLTKLVAVSSGLTDAGLRTPFHDSSVSELNISQNPYVTGMGWVNFFRSLHHNSSLKELNISLDKLDEEGSEALAQMISHNKTLTVYSVL